MFPSGLTRNLDLGTQQFLLQTRRNQSPPGDHKSNLIKRLGQSGRFDVELSRQLHAVAPVPLGRHQGGVGLGDEVTDAA